MIKKIAFTIVVTPIVLAVLLVTAILSVLNWPTIVINPATLGMAARHLAPLGIGITWRNAAATSTSHGFLDETIKIAFDDLCIAAKPARVHACFARVKAAGRYRFMKFVPRLVALGPLTATEGSVTVTIGEDRKPPAKPKGRIDVPAIRLPAFVREIELNPIAIELANVTVTKGPTTYAGSLDIKGISPEGKIERIDITASIDEQPAGRTLDLTAAVESPTGFIEDDWQLRAAASAALGTAGAAAVDIEMVRTDDHALEYRATARHHKDALSAAAQIEGKIEPEALELTITGSLDGISDIIRTVSLPRCAMKLDATDRALNRGAFALSCPIDIGIKKVDLPDELDGVYRSPETIRLGITSQAAMFFLPDLEQSIDGTLNVRLEPSRSLLVHTGGNFTTSFSGKLSSPPAEWTIETDVDISFIIREVQKLIAVMNATRWKTPAPFNTLTGSVELSLEGHLSMASGLGRFPVALAAHLRSAKQVIDIDGEGEVQLILTRGASKIQELHADITLVDVQLELPDVALAGIPRFTPDGRIILNPERTTKKPHSDSPFNYRIRVATREENPARILSNLTPTFIPVTADIIIDNGEIAGSVSLLTFPVRLFNRTATLDRMIFDLKEPMEESTVQGSLSYEFPELKAMVIIDGPFAGPRISLESKPPMPPGDILATIVYGEPMNKIDSDQANSVGNMNAAMTSNALALTSFILLGSTPIQGVAYDPSTGVFSARVRLAEKTSLVVGAGGGAQQAMVRQRLGKGFSISAGADKSPDDAQTAGAAYIEWSKRF